MKRFLVAAMVCLGLTALDCASLPSDLLACKKVCDASDSVMIDHGNGMCLCAPRATMFLLDDEGCK